MQMQPSTQSHPGLGVASFVISLVAGVLLLLIFGIAGLLESRPGGLDEESVAANLLGLLLLFMALAQLVALGLGIAGLAQAGRSKLFGALGTAFAALARRASLAAR